MNRDTAFECAQKTRKKAGVPLFIIFDESWHRPKNMQKHGEMGFFQARRIRRSLKNQSGMLSRSASSSVAARAISSHSAAGTL